MSNNLRDLVEKIKYLGKYSTIEDVAKSIGYTRVHLTKEMAKDGPSELENLLRDKHSGILQNVSNETHFSKHGGPIDQSVYRLVSSNQSLAEANKALAMTNYELSILLRRPASDEVRNRQDREPTFLEAYHSLLKAGVSEGRWLSEDEGQAKLGNVILGIPKKPIE